MLGVKETHRKQGIGTALLTQFIKEMKQQNVKRIELEVRTSNTGAVRFYQVKGFLLQTTLQQFYQNGENAYSMSKEL